MKKKKEININLLKWIKPIFSIPPRNYDGERRLGIYVGEWIDGYIDFILYFYWFCIGLRIKKLRRTKHG